MSATIEYDRGAKGYRLTRFEREWLTNQETLALCKILLESRALEKTELRGLIEKLLTQASPNDRTIAEDIIRSEYGAYVPLKHGKKLLEALWRISLAIHRHKEISFFYTRKDGMSHRRTVKPLSIMFSEYYFYVIALYDDADEGEVYRTYRIDRLTDLKETGKSSYSNRPKQIFDAACVRTSIIQLGKTNTPMEHLYTSKLIRRSDKYSISDIIKNLQFVDSCEFKVPGRYAKIGSDEQLNIVRKMFSHGCKLSDYADENGLPIYYRAAGGRYFNVVTPYPTGSSQEKPYTIKREYANVVGAILSTSLFWFYQQAYTDGLHIKQSEIESVPLFNMSNLSNDDLQCIENVYREYLDEIENNAGQLNVSADSSYNVDSVKVYKLSKSKNFIDRLDDCIDKFYGLNSTEINYIKEFEVEFRMGE
ncbi:MAG: WYL domain-containing protein [Selenomonadaceae bacterium]|nr:WYL domain-containing protein [Selenomonadaceae bacterium]